MEDIEKLKQDNIKLQERLNNAAKFFREQKAQIESLIKENEILVEKTKTYEHKIDNLENNNDDVQKLEIKINELQKTITSKDQAYKVLQDTYNEVFAEKEKITKQYKEQEKFETEVINVKVPELEERLKNIEKAYKELKDKYKENDIARGSAELQLKNVQKEYTDKFNEQEQIINSLKKKFDSQNQEFIEISQQLEVANVDNVEYKNKIDTIQEQLNKLNKLYDDCENEKLAINADYESLNEKYKKLELDIINKDEIIKLYQEELFNENICKYNKDDINNLCDYILDFFKDKQLIGDE